MGDVRVVHMGTRLHYPVTITRLLKKPGDAIEARQVVFEYKFNWQREIEEGRFKEETSYADFESPAEGTLREWKIEEGEVVKAPQPYMAIEEACPHDVQLGNMCAKCGKDMTEVNFATAEERDTDRANVNMVHDNVGLVVSNEIAMSNEYSAQKRLLSQRKLSLVVDLDQTVIHACVDRTVAEWKADPSNPNYEAVCKTKAFTLTETHDLVYHVKMRPGLSDFLAEVSEMYELHVYTMGTRSYAENIVALIDPDHTLFGQRIITRTESGSMHAKSLQRIFPVSTNMVVIIDDRSDVWPYNRPNLIKVVPYAFFKGIGDINSNFLPPATKEAVPAALPEANGSAAPTGQATTEAQPPTAPDADKAVLAMRLKDDEEKLKEQAEEQEKDLQQQVEDRPLLHMQEELEKEDEAQGEEPKRHILLTDDDEELIALQDHLTDVHKAFYALYDKRRRQRKSGQAPQHKPGETKVRRPSNDTGVDLSLVPDVGDILENLKQSVLEGLVIATSGLVKGGRVEYSEIGQQAQAFGAQVVDEVSKRITHLVVSPTHERSEKVRQAVRLRSVRIVSQSWLLDCLSQWRRLDESAYFVSVESLRREEAERRRKQGEAGSGSVSRDGTPAEDDPTGELDLGDDDDMDDEEFRKLLDLDSDEDFGDMNTSTDEEEEEEASETDDDRSSRASDGGLNSSQETEGGANNGASTTVPTRTKRKKPSGEDTDGESDRESVMAKKQRIARSRPSGLRSEAVIVENGTGPDAGDDSTMLPTPGTNGGDVVNLDRGDEEIDFDEDELERDMEAAFEEAEDDD
ncbi:uncharacterized protein F5Z01DRAFT_473985 [Emericellopsis atlantica]|uniref:RNA polymerase II subunit A C-terminal domain phosphatase n=1 Tax=Emericellopsis atlantica TaxID=2614577 RepID=A0A9P7ZCE7_9HYPO|nr:uncharacterized protein F5Z01DRAFT_473985 [Emericellopsis atlantica]KAG9249608.1 hypothetical protein F5Z01DRAFT_473985 [Emericellopsis atlantica]